MLHSLQPAQRLSPPSHLSPRSTPIGQVGLRVLEVINLLICLGDSLLPNPATFESFAYEIVRRHASFEKLYKVPAQHQQPTPPASIPTRPGPGISRG